MNAKRCKRIRRALAGLPVAEFKMEYFRATLFPLTFKHPENSYQRVYRDVKRVS